MASVRCEYCGNYISDLQKKCPVCGAPNKDYKRTASNTPKTIEELRSWYAARKLPPEEVTRFFIGKDIREPRAFGIYEEDGKFIVYKNKNDGSRAIRYQGTDEAYAVNELYIKLKEEILNQKNLNVRRKNTNRNNKNRNKTKKTFIPLTILIILFILMPIIIGVASFISFETHYNNSFHYHDYYLTDNNEIYFYDGYSGDGKDDWWIYDINTKNWNLYERHDSSEMVPDGVYPQNRYILGSELASKLGLEYDEFNIYDSKNYIDAGHHYRPSTAYYYYDDNLYYFLYDNHSNYGSSDNTGWYIYKDDDWEYLCDYEDKEILGDDLWYNDSDYSIGKNLEDIYYYVDDISASWNPSNFEDTSWYQSYESNNNAYNEHIANQSSNKNDSGWDWSSDSDWDWDSGDSWDSGGTDWDSDW